MIINNTGSNTEYARSLPERHHRRRLVDVRETGHTDEYNIDFAGNFNDVVFWGLGVGIIDMEYTRQTNYSESMSDAYIYYTPDKDKILVI